jgi:hypothetical protein
MSSKLAAVAKAVGDGAVPRPRDASRAPVVVSDKCKGEPPLTGLGLVTAAGERTRLAGVGTRDTRWSVRKVVWGTVTGGGGDGDLFSRSKPGKPNVGVTDVDDDGIQAHNCH